MYIYIYIYIHIYICISIYAENQVVPSQRDVPLSSSINIMDTLSQGEKIDNKSNEMVNRTEAAGKRTDFNNVIEEIDSVSYGIHDTILNRDAR